ncbi:XDD3 family exosortase-dependent surface protein, partial [Spirulina sp. 06S082]|uniref:XDD3 family exosortase-dependent surface protein n=1 Tax=Spirulina sp. 06S082 TaxID=3110248 RepID=UPI002B1EF91C
AGTLHTKTGFDTEWNYSIDALKDGYDRTIHNYRGLALTETNGQYIFALSAGLNYNEESELGITHGDLLLNFSGENFNLANGGDKLFGVKFAPKNDTDLALGLYSNVVAGDINAFANIDHTPRWDSLRDYYSTGYGKLNSYGTDLISVAPAYEYFYSKTIDQTTDQNTPFMNGIQSGTKIGDVSMLDQATLAGLGLDFEHFGVDAVGSSIFGIAIDKSLFAGLLPSGISEVMAHVILENGDGVAVKGELNISEEGGVDPNRETTPEPTALLGLSLIGLAFLKGARRHSTHRTLQEN